MINKRLQIYVAGPYTANNAEETQRNVDNAIDTGIKIWNRGHYPYIPHLTHYVNARPTCKLSWRDYIEWDRVWLQFCDALFYLGSSEGADSELKEAEESGKRIFLSFDEIPLVPRPTP
jgi:hypothetical protein